MEHINIFNNHDIVSINDNMSDLMKKIIKNKKLKLRPKIEIIKNIRKLIFDFIKKKKKNNLWWCCMAYVN